MILPHQRRDDTCTFALQGTFTQSLPSVHLSLNLSSRPGDETPRTIVAIVDDLCDWIEIKQDGRVSCPPKKGPATIVTEVDFPGGWLPEVSLMSMIRGEREGG